MALLLNSIIKMVALGTHQVFDTLTPSVCEKKINGQRRIKATYYYYSLLCMSFTILFSVVCAIIPDTNFELLYTYIQEGTMMLLLYPNTTIIVNTHFGNGI